MKTYYCALEDFSVNRDSSWNTVKTIAEIATLKLVKFLFWMCLLINDFIGILSAVSSSPKYIVWWIKVRVPSPMPEVNVATLHPLWIGPRAVAYWFWFKVCRPTDGGAGATSFPYLISMCSLKKKTFVAC